MSDHHSDSDSDQPSPPKRSKSGSPSTARLTDSAQSDQPSPFSPLTQGSNGPNVTKYIFWRRKEVLDFFEQRGIQPRDDAAKVIERILGKPMGCDVVMQLRVGSYIRVLFNQ